MSGLDRRPNRTPRSVRERRAYRLAMVGGTAGVVTVVGGVLAILGIVSGSIPVIALLIAIACIVLFRATVR
jgi:hypothetical protein